MMGRHITITVYFADEGFQRTLAALENEDALDTLLEQPFHKQAHDAMEKRRHDAMEDIDLYVIVTNDGGTYTYDEVYHSQCSIVLPKKADLDAGLLALVYHLFARGQITGFTVMHTGA